MAEDPIIRSINPMPKQEEDEDREQRIRRRAHELWEAEGMPSGRATDHWLAAEREQEDTGPEPSLGTPLVPGEDIPAIRSADDAGLGTEVRQKEETSPAVPRTAGAPEAGPDTSRSRVANRDTEGPRKAGTTPRPTDKPVTGS